MRLYFRYVSMLVRSAMQYRASFVLTVLGTGSTTFFTFLGVYFLFERFGTLLDYSFGEVALCFGVINLAFSITECYARGFDMFFSLIVSGNFDRLLLRPRALVLQVFGTQFEMTRIGRVSFAAMVLAIAIANLQVVWTLPRIACLVFMVVGGIGIFTGIFMLAATLCFVTIQGLEVANIFTDGGRELAGYPLTIFGKWVSRFFTFIIPFGAVNYLPLLYLTGRAQNPMYALIPLLGLLYIFPCLWVWHRGARKYISTGS